MDRNHPFEGDDVLSARADRLEAWLQSRLEEHAAVEAPPVRGGPSLSIMVTKGTLDWAYPPLIMGSTASALGWDATLFFTFYGLGLLKKDLELKISPLGNPAMPMKMPVGPGWFRDIEWNLPNLLMAGVPGFESMATAMMRKTLRDKGVASVEELRDLCIEADVKLIGCQMTVDLFGWKQDDFIPQVAEWAGAATYLSIARDSDISLYV